MNARYFASDDGARLCYRTWPANVRAIPARSQPVVMLHSLFFDSRMFDDVCAWLPAEYPVFAIDHRGQGDSERADSAPSIDRLASDVIVLIEQVIGQPVHLVGSSMGGYVAMRVAERRPDLLRSSTWSCCTAHAERQPERFAALEANIRANGTAMLGETLLATMFGERFVTANDARCRHWRAVFESRGPGVADAVHEVFAREGAEAMLANLQMPLLLFSGELDRAKRPADMTYIAERVAGSRHVVLADAGHTPPVESPAIFAAELVRFWREVSPPDGAIRAAQTNKG